MDDDVSNELTPTERSELAALRRRAYAPDADIDGDQVALARLAALEQRMRMTRSDAAAPRATSATVDTATRVRPRPPARTRLVVIAAVLAIFAGITTASSAAPSPTAPAAVAATTTDPSAPDTSEAPIPAVADHEWSIAFAEGYNDNLRRLRTAALSGPNTEFDDIVRRLDIERLLPKGTIDGRSVWAGPTIDGVMCLVLGGDGGPIVGCATPAALAARGLAVIAPPANAQWDSPDPANTPAAALSSYSPVKYTLLADGTVTTETVTW